MLAKYCKHIILFAKGKAPENYSFTMIPIEVTVFLISKQTRFLVRSIKFYHKSVNTREAWRELVKFIING